jgi:cytochrome c oxidase subunit 1
MPEASAAGLRKLTLVWCVTAVLLFAILALLGFGMRMAQANFIPAMPPERFYAMLTLHGLGNVGTWYVLGMAGVSYLLSRYVKLHFGVSLFAYAGTLIGVVLLIAATLAGQFGTGWYFLYPLPFFAQGVWQPWATVAFFLAITVFGVAWLVWTIDLLWGIASRYSLSQALCWHYLRGKSDPEIPPLVIIATVSLISAVAGILGGVVVLAMFALEGLTRSFVADALLMKNLTFFFGHQLVNITMYFGVAIVYELLPAYNGRPWKTNKVVAIAWNLVLLLVAFAYFHHLYMDFAQPRALQVIGQIASYAISVPAAVVSIFGTLALVYASRMRWTLSSMLFFLGIMGWAIGGVGAVIDSTIAVNFRFHNTLWVPAHFHTYFLMGVVLMLLGFVDWLSQDLSGQAENPSLSRATVALVALGGYGFLALFYLGGANSVPRRYAVYPDEIHRGVSYARAAVLFVTILLAGVVLYLWQTGKRCVRAFAS